MLAELVEGISLFRARQTGDNVAGQARFIFIAHGGETLIRLSDLFGGIVRFRARALEDMQFKGGEFNLIETQGFGAIRQDVFQIGTGPVEDRHKVVAHGTDAALGQIAQALLVVSDPLRVVAGMGFDLFVNRYAFDHRPYQPGGFHDGFTLEDFGIWCRAVTTPVAPA